MGTSVHVFPVLILRSTAGNRHSRYMPDQNGGHRMSAPLFTPDGISLLLPAHVSCQRGRQRHGALLPPRRRPHFTALDSDAGRPLAEIDCGQNCIDPRRMAVWSLLLFRGVHRLNPPSCHRQVEEPTAPVLEGYSPWRQVTGRRCLRSVIIYPGHQIRASGMQVMLGIPSDSVSPASAYRPLRSRRQNAQLAYCSFRIQKYALQRYRRLLARRVTCANTQDFY